MPRKQHLYHFIYKTTCKVNENFYIGMHSTSNLEDGYLGSGKRLWYSIRKHGKENHETEILEMLEDRSSLKCREKEIVNLEMLKDPKCMNLMVGGEGGADGFSTEYRAQRMKKTIGKLWEDPIYRENAIEKIKERSKRLYEERKDDPTYFKFDWRGKKHTEETKLLIGQKNSVAQTGSKNSQFGKVWITNGKENKSIKQQDLSSYIENGWQKGRKC